MKTRAFIAVLTCMAAPAFAQGDVSNGEAQFGRQCVACHVVRDASGQVLAGRNAKVGPNLFGVAGNLVAASEGFRYGDSITEVGETDAVWSEENFVAYVQDPTQWLRDTLADRRARSKMGYKVRSNEEALDIFAYLSSLAP